jgi:phage N-6-adenine-methyltransferase
MEPEEQEEIAQRIEQGEPPKEVVAEVRNRPHVANNSGNNEWYTPAEYIEAAREVMGSIDIDPASNDIAQETVKAKIYYTAETNGLDKEWSGNVWMNPPYASDLIGKFIEKLISELPNIAQAIVLVNNATETEWFNKLISNADAVCFPRSRVKFYMPDGKTGAPLQGQAVLYFGTNESKFVDVFSGKGWCAIPV